MYVNKVARRWSFYHPHKLSHTTLWRDFSCSFAFKMIKFLGSDNFTKYWIWSNRNFVAQQKSMRKCNCLNENLRSMRDSRFGVSCFKFVLSSFRVLFKCWVSNCRKSEKGFDFCRFSFTLEARILRVVKILFNFIYATFHKCHWQLSGEFVIR